MIRRALTLASLIVLAFATSANAQITIESFTTASTDTQASGHPGLTTSFELAEPGVFEATKDVTFEAPEGLFGNPNALSRCSASDFAQQQCPVNSQAGLIAIRANYVGDPDFLMGTAPLFDMA